MQRLPAMTHTRFGLLRFRSPLLTESQLFSSPAGTEMFHFPAFPPTTLYIQVEVAGHDSGNLRGFPIRTSTDQSSFTNSPWLIAGYNVLHRLLMPRHPPIALSSLSPTHKKTGKKQELQDARVHYTILKQQTNTHPQHPQGRQKKALSETHHHTNHGGSPRTQQRAHPHPPSTHHTFHTHHTASSTHTANTQETRTRSMLPQKHPPPSPHHTRARKNSTTCRPRKNLSGTRAP